MGRFGAYVAKLINSFGQEVLHKARLDAVLLCDEGFGLFNSSVYQSKDLCDWFLFWEGQELKR